MMKNKIKQGGTNNEIIGQVKILNLHITTIKNLIRGWGEIIYSIGRYFF